jgi:hypothetical protein
VLPEAQCQGWPEAISEGNAKPLILRGSTSQFRGHPPDLTSSVSDHLGGPPHLPDRRRVAMLPVRQLPLRSPADHRIGHAAGTPQRFSRPYVTQCPAGLLPGLSSGAPSMSPKLIPRISRAPRRQRSEGSERCGLDADAQYRPVQIIAWAPLQARRRRADAQHPQARRSLPLRARTNLTCRSPRAGPGFPGHLSGGREQSRVGKYLGTDFAWCCLPDVPGPPPLGGRALEVQRWQ